MSEIAPFIPGLEGRLRTSLTFPPSPFAIAEKAIVQAFRNASMERGECRLWVINRRGGCERA